ncbi:MAG: hypothetical protein C4516_09125 [Oxalobacter sp.]|nr:MAG: hypothetical protein C4516_09125 [Oxalobacter sp.]
MSTKQNLRQVAQQLLQLTGLSVAEVARRSEVHRPNFLAWLAGKERVLSEKRQLKVCECLGWRFGRLRRDMVHCWEVNGDLSACQKILAAHEGKKTDVTLMVFQAEGREAQRVLIILGLSSNEPTLVILIRRPLGYTIPMPITALQLGRGFDQGGHRISTQEWRDCWQRGARLLSPEDYLATYGGEMLDMAKKEYPMLNQSQIFADFHEEECAALLNMSGEKLAWLELFSKAMGSGMSFDEVMQRTSSALNITDAEEAA